MRAQAVDDGSHALGVFTHPEQGVFLADEAGEALAHLDHTAVHGEIGPEGFDRLDPGWRVALEAVAHARDLVVACLEEAATVTGVVELGLFELFDGIYLPSPRFGHGKLEMFADSRAETRPDDHFLASFLQCLERPDPRVHVWAGDDPVQIVMVIGIGVGGQTAVPGASGG